MVIGKNIRKKRRELDLTQKAVAAMCNITQSYYAQIEHGKSVPSFGILAAVARSLGLKIEEIAEV